MGPFDRFSDQAKRTLGLAQNEALRFGHDHIGTEHLLLGLLALPGSAAARVLAQHGLTTDGVRADVVRICGRTDLSPSMQQMNPALTGTFGIAKGLVHALKTPEVTPEHLLLELLINGDCVGAQIASRSGVTVAEVDALVTGG